jgi:hypothetical protein
MKLTGRQRAFLSTFLDLYREAQEPLHYTTVAQRLGVSKITAYDMLRLLEEILARLPQRQSSMLYAAEMITAVILSLHQLREDASAAGLLDKLRALGLPGEAGLSALAGLALGLSFAERINRRLISLLLSYTGRYQEIISRLSAENLQRLSSFAGEVIKIVET